MLCICTHAHGSCRIALLRIDHEALCVLRMYCKDTATGARRHDNGRQTRGLIFKKWKDTATGARGHDNGRQRRGLIFKKW